MTDSKLQTQALDILNVIAFMPCAIDRIKAIGYESVKSYNPDWDNNGVTFEDPDGYRIVLQNTSWEERSLNLQAR